MKRTSRPGQRGAVLFVGLIMLILITLIAVSAIRLANTNLLVVGNEQFQREAENAANYHLDLALNSDNFTMRNVDRSAPLPAFSGATERPETNYSVTIRPPVCKRYRYLKKGELTTETRKTDETTGKEIIEVQIQPGNLACFGSSSGTAITMVLTEAQLNENSLCATSLWEMTANVELPGTGAKTQVMQGVEMRIDYAEAMSACKPAI